MITAPAFLPPAMVAEATGTLAKGGHGPVSCSAVCIDSRKVKKDSLFVALPGERVDGHLFINEALDAGARMVLLEGRKLDEELLKRAASLDAALFPVDNTLHALQACARRWVDEFPSLLRIGITGSSGKTTTKEILASILSVDKRVVMNEGNLNSETGLPLSVFAIRREHEVGVFELGMNHQGEMAQIASVLHPSIALITNIGSAHIGILGSKEAIAKEKREIFSCFDKDSIAVLPEDDAFLDFLSTGLEGPVLLFGPRNQKAFGGILSQDETGMEIAWAGQRVRVNLGGEHNVRNILAACRVATALGVNDESIVKGLASLPVLFGRGEVLRGEVTLARDCYNANPEAVLASIAWADSLPCKGKRIYVIGDMLELGEYAKDFHRSVGEALVKSAADLVVLFGSASAETALRMVELGAGDRILCQSSLYEEIRETLRPLLKTGDLVLLKGSRGMALERLGEALVPQSKSLAGEVS